MRLSHVRTIGRYSSLFDPLAVVFKFVVIWDWRAVVNDSAGFGDLRRAFIARASVVQLVAGRLLDRFENVHVDFVSDEHWSGSFQRGLCVLFGLMGSQQC